MLILGLLGMYFDAVVVFVTNSSLLFRFAMAILWFIVSVKSCFGFIWLYYAFLSEHTEQVSTYCACSQMKHLFSTSCFTLFFLLLYTYLVTYLSKILVYTASKTKRNYIKKIEEKIRVSVQGVESLWSDCRFIPAD